MLHWAGWKNPLFIVPVILLVLGCTCKCKMPAAPSPPPPVPASASLNVQYEEQPKDSLWCWAASAVMVSKTLGFPTTQCDVANVRFFSSTCCSGGVPSAACDKRAWPPFKEMGFCYRNTSDTALTYDQLKNEIGVAKRPIAFSWEYVDIVNNVPQRTDDGHMMVAGGYKRSGADDMVEIYDPICLKPADGSPPPPQGCGYKLILYSDYVEGEMLNGTVYLHWDDFYEIRKP